VSIQEQHHQLVESLKYALANRFGMPVDDLSYVQLQRVNDTAYRALLNAQGRANNAK